MLGQKGVLPRLERGASRKLCLGLTLSENHTTSWMVVRTSWILSIADKLTPQDHALKLDGSFAS
jgi:hypothetical protein